MWTKEQFQAWKSRQETKDFMGFVREYLEDLKDRWAKGAQLSEEDHAIAMVYSDLLDMEYKWVAEFYGLTEEGEDEDDD